jgi:hypothetical protein
MMGLLLAGLSPVIVEGAGIVGGTIIFLICLAAAGFIGWLWFATYYVLREFELFIRSGPITKTIPLHSIAKVKLVRSWIASAATSSRRVEIYFGKYDYIHISPLDQEAFLNELKKRCPQVRIEGAT